MAQARTIPGMNAALRPWLAERLPAMTTLLTDIVRAESPTHDKAGVDAVGAIVQRELRALGADVTVHPRQDIGNHVLGVLNAGAGSPIFLFLHMDTVHPVGSFAPRFKQEDGKLYGPGIFDMKASSVIALNAIGALKALHALPGREIRVLFTSDEEIGSGGSRALIESLAQGAALCMCMEPALSDGRMKHSRRGCGDFLVRAHGRAAHAGSDHAKGVNAIWELSTQIPKIQALTDYTRGTATTCGLIKGGTAANVIPDYAEAVVDARVDKGEDAAWLSAQILGLQPTLPGARLEISGGFDRPPMEYNDDRRAIVQRLTTIAATTGLALTSGPSGAGSDASFTAQIAPTMDGFGAVGDGLHAPHEHIVIDSLIERTAFCAAVIKDW
jgi:glutamate carboxypeptidase